MDTGDNIDEVKVEVQSLADLAAEDGEKKALNSDTAGSSSGSETEAKQPISLMSRIIGYLDSVRSLLDEHSNIISRVVKGLLFLGFAIYIIAALTHNLKGALPLIIFTSFVGFCIGYELLKQPLASGMKKIANMLCATRADLLKRWLPVMAYILVGCLGIWLLIDIIINDVQQLQSLLGLFSIIVICVLFSKHPNQIAWKPVIWGIVMQVVLGLIVLRTKSGYTAIKFTGDQVVSFMSYTNNGTDFVFNNTAPHIFVMKILPMIIFFSTVTSVLFYLGLMQWFIKKLAFFTQLTLGVSAIESTVAVANIFVGMTEAPLTVRPYLERLTKAEIHSIMCSGMGSIAMGVVGAYIGFSIDAVHILTACVMTAPATLVISRLLYPETEESEFADADKLEMTGGDARNVVEAAAIGASQSISLVANIGANLIAFIALMAFIDATLSWFASFVGLDIGFSDVCGYLFVPVAFLMGVRMEDCVTVGQLIGVKTFINEFVAFEQLGVYVKNRQENLDGIVLSERSEAIATHALCGFCNVGSLGIIIGGLGAIMPGRKADLADSAIRALVGAMLACFMTASIAGLMFQPKIDIASTMTNMTMLDNITATTARMTINYNTTS